MGEKKEKANRIVKSIKQLEGVLKTTPNQDQRERVKKAVDKLRKTLKAMYPDVNLSELEDTIFSELMALPKSRTKNIKDYECLKDIEINNITPYKDDVEINDAASIMKYYEDKIWGVLSDQHTKLDYSNSNDRDTLYRKLDGCERALKVYCQTIEDLGKAMSSEFNSQLQMMRVRQGRLFLFEIHEFFSGAENFVSNIISNSEFGGTMILNHDEEIKSEEYENDTLFEGWKVLDSLKYMKKFLNESLSYINFPELK